MRKESRWQLRYLLLCFLDLLPVMPPSNLRKVSQKIIDKDVGSVLIKQEEEIVGIITEKDLLRAVLRHRDFETTEAKEIMSSPLDCCEAEDSLERCMDLLRKTNRSRLVVKQEGKVVGVMSKKIVERFLRMSKIYSLAEVAKNPRFRTGRWQL